MQPDIQRRTRNLISRSIGWIGVSRVEPGAQVHLFQKCIECMSSSPRNTEWEIGQIESLLLNTFDEENLRDDTAWEATPPAQRDRGYQNCIDIDSFAHSRVERGSLDPGRRSLLQVCSWIGAMKKGVGLHGAMDLVQLVPAFLSMQCFIGELGPIGNLDIVKCQCVLLANVWASVLGSGLDGSFDPLRGCFFGLSCVPCWVRIRVFKGGLHLRVVFLVLWDGRLSSLPP